MAINKVIYAGSTLIDLSSDTVVSSKMLSGVTAHDKAGSKITGSIASQAAQTITPGTANKTIAAGKYLSGKQTIKGDANLVAANIKSGVSIFGVKGTYETPTYAVIGVTYPAGSVCTCTDGTKTLSLKDTSGQGFFLIPYAGTWIVTATDGTNTKSESVEITSEGQSVSVTLSYRLYLFDNGVVSGIAWDKESKGGFVNWASSSVSNTISLGASGAYDGAFYNSNVIRGTSDSHDLSAYSTLKLNVSAISSYGTSKIYIGTTALGKDIHTSEINRNTGVVSVDISSINGSYFISLYNSAVYGAVGTSTISIDKIWLE